MFIRDMVVGPVDRLDLEPVGSGILFKDNVIEMYLSASQYRQQDFKEGEILLPTPRNARVFLTY